MGGKLVDSQRGLGGTPRVRDGAGSCHICIVARYSKTEARFRQKLDSPEKMFLATDDCASDWAWMPFLATDFAMQSIAESVNLHE